MRMKHGLGFAIVLVILAYSYDRVVFLIKDCMDVIPLAVVFAIGLSALSAYFTRLENMVDHWFLSIQFSFLIFCVMDHSPIRQTFELGKFISTAGKSITNLVKL